MVSPLGLLPWKISHLIMLENQSIRKPYAQVPILWYQVLLQSIILFSHAFCLMNVILGRDDFSGSTFFKDQASDVLRIPLSQRLGLLEIANSVKSGTSFNY